VPKSIVQEGFLKEATFKPISNEFICKKGGWFRVPLHSSICSVSLLASTNKIFLTSAKKKKKKRRWVIRNEGPPWTVGWTHEKAWHRKF
jgi:hypothetical protein